MVLISIDWIIIIVFLSLLTAIGLIASRAGGKDSTSYFLSGRSMPWWLLGFSMVATTFSIATPNLVTDMVRSGGVARNWLWLAFLLSGMLTVFVYAKLWSRSKILTDLEFYELRYSGKTAAALRGFRAIYLGFFYNILVLGGSSLAFMKITAIMTDIDPLMALIAVSFLVLLYSAIGGLKSILWTDLFMFLLSIAGAVIPAYLIITSPKIGGMSNFIQHEALQGRLSLIPDFSDPVMLVTILVIPLTIQWWAAWYPGSEPGGGGFIAQRMLAAKSEKHAVGATLFFNMIHYAVRPWPWIIVALGSIIIFPNIDAMIQAYHDVPAAYIQDDIAYPIMIREFVPHGYLGIVVVSLVAAYMSTTSTLINWGASYLVNDFHIRFIHPEASERKKVFIGRIWTICILVCATVIAVFLDNALQAFQYMIMIGAGTGLIYLLRWFWWRINAWSELSAMAAAVLFSIVFIIIEGVFLIRVDHYVVSVFGMEMSLALWDSLKFVAIVLFTTIIWLIVTFTTKPTDEQVLINFYNKTRPGGPGWKNVAGKTGINKGDVEKDWNVPTGLACMSLGCLSVYSLLFSIGHMIYGNLAAFVLLLIISIVSSLFIFRLWGRLFN